MSNSLWPHGLQPAKPLCPWGFSRQEYWSGLPCPPPGKMEYYSAIKNEFESILVRWMNLEPVIQSEASQKRKNRFSILMHIYGISKNDFDESICREGIERQMQSVDLWTQLMREWVGPVEKVASMVYTHSGVGWIAGKKLLCSTGSPVWHSVMTWRDGMVGGEGG